MRRARRYDGSLALGLLALTALAVPPASGALGPRYGGELAILFNGALPASDPAFPRSAPSRAMLGLVHETLLRTRADGLPEPSLAEGWGSAASGREWTLRLRPETTFHDGAPVTSADAVRSLRRFLRSASPAAERLASFLDGGPAFRLRHTEDLPGLETGAGRVVLRAPPGRDLPPIALATLAAPGAAVVSPKGAGAGPFLPSTAGRRDATLIAFAGHVRGRPYLDRLHLTNNASALDASVARLDLSAPSREPVTAAALVLFLQLEPSAPPFVDPSVRHRVATAVDSADLARHYLAGAEPLVALLPRALLAPPPEPRTGARDDIRDLSGRVTLRVSTDVPALASQRVVAHLTALGLDVRAQGVPPESVLDDEAEARLFFWAPEVPDPFLALAELADRVAGAGPPVRDALAVAMGDADPDRRRLALHAAEESLRAAHVLVPLAVQAVPFQPGRTVHGVRADLAGRVLVEDAWVEP